jgi:hypothetical protein
MGVVPASLPLPELAARAWQEAQERQEAERREWRDDQRQRNREMLQASIESSLRVTADLDAIVCPLSDEQLENGVPDGGIVARTVIDGLALALVRRGHSYRINALPRCPNCQQEVHIGTAVESLEVLGQVLANDVASHFPCPAKGGAS